MNFLSHPFSTAGLFPRTAHHLKRRPTEFQAKAIGEQGDIARMRFGRHDYVVVANPTDIEEILISKAEDFPRGEPYKTWKKAQKRRSDGPAVGPYTSRDRHLPVRRGMQATFSAGRASEQSDSIFASATSQMSDWPASQTGKAIDIFYDLCMSLTIDSIFGEYDLDEKELTRLYKQAVFLRDSRYSKSQRINHYFRLRQRADGIEAYGRIWKAFDQALDKGQTDSNSLFARLALLESDGVINRDGATNEAMSMLLTVNNGNLGLVTWTLYELLKNPGTLQELRSRLKAAANPAEDKYLEAVLNESLRLHPTIVAITREAERDVDLPGGKIRKGDIIEISPWITQRDERWWPDPLKFDPNRWLENTPVPRPKLSYLPFGAGARKCIAQTMALGMGSAALASILTAFDIQSRSFDADDHRTLPENWYLSLSRF